MASTRGSATESCASGWNGVVRVAPFPSPSFPPAAALEASENSLPCEGDLVSGGVTGSDLGTAAAEPVADIWKEESVVEGGGARGGAEEEGGGAPELLAAGGGWKGG